MTGGNPEASSVSSFLGRSKETLMLLPKRFRLRQAGFDFPAGGSGFVPESV